MPTAAASVSLGASASVARFRASIAVVRPGVSSVTYSVPAAALEYIELIASGYMDTTGFFQFKSDIALVLDQKSITFSKQLADVQALADAVFKASAKQVADSFSPADAAPRLTPLKAVSDSVAMSDATTRAVARVLAEAFATSDQPFKTAGMALASQFGLTDAQTVQAQKLIQDSVSFVEALIAVRTFVREFNEAVTPSDLPAKTVTKSPFIELISVDDAGDVLPIKNIFDAVAMDDGTSIGDGSTYFFQKYLNNVALLSDADSIQTVKPVADQFALADSGLVSMQGYCDITYFAEYYVGTSSSF
jgi:hypothetical protein